MMKLARRRRSRGTGFTLIETLFAVSIFGLLAALLGWMMVDTSRLSLTVSTSATLESQARIRLDMFTSDVHDASTVLASYVNNGTTYTSNTTSSLVIQAPSYDSTGSIIAGSYDYTYYHLVGSAAPYTLNRVVMPASGSARAAVSDTVIASNVQSVNFICVVDQTWQATGSTAFALSSQVSGSGNSLVQSATMNGAAVTLGSSGQAQFLAPTTAYPQGYLSFTNAPAVNSLIDVLYSVDPSQSANQPNITGVIMDLVVQITDTGEGRGAVQTVEMSGRSNLHNH
jgi:prepilin-type N-terminal cleavage/methylation domain-containing protein